MRAQPITIGEKEMILEALKNGKRFDFRELAEFRDVKLIVGSESGSAICAIGKTKVVAAVSAEIAEPSLMRPHKGIVNIDVDLSPIANISNEHDRLGSKGMELIRLLELIIRDSRCIDVESLCIRAGKEIWKIRVDIRILDEDGSLLDCSCLAAITALQHFKRPNVTLEPHHTLVYSEYEKAPVPLNIYHMPICTTIGLIDNGQMVIVDPSGKEASCLDGSIVVACNKRKEVCALHQSTDLVLSTKQIETCVKLAMDRAESLSTVVSDVIKQDQRERIAFKRPDGFAITTSLLVTSGSADLCQIQPPDISNTDYNKKTSENVYQSSVIMNESPLSVGSVKQAEVEEDALVSKQLAVIQASVEQVDLIGSRINANSNRKREVAEVINLLDGLGDEEEEDIIKPNGSQMRSCDVQAEDDLLLAKKRKKQ